MKEYADIYKLDFNGTLNYTKVIKDQKRKDFMASVRDKKNNKRSSSLNGLEIIDHNFRVTQDTYYNPAAELKKAIQMIREGKTLTFNEEYAIENLWHEIMHCKAKGWVDYSKAKGSARDAMETINQFVARNTYDDFLYKLGGKAMHKKTILTKGYGYKSEVKNFYGLLGDHGIDRSKALAFFETEIVKAKYEDIEALLSEFLKNPTIENLFK